MKNYLEKIPDSYRESVEGRGYLRYWIGYFVRLVLYVKYSIARWVARFKGARIGACSILPIRLALRSNYNLEIGDDTIVEAADLDLRGKIIIGSHCIVNKKVEILRVSHYIDSDRKFTTRYYPDLQIGDFTWLATGCKILPSCCNIAPNSVVGAYAVCVKDVEPNSVYSGFPAKKLKDKNCSFDNIVVCSLMGGDFLFYRKIKHV